MKKRYLLLEFLLIFTFLIIPPLFVTEGQGLSKAGSFSPSAAFQLAAALILQLQSVWIFPKKKESPCRKIFRCSFWWSITLGCLMLTFAFMQLLAIFFEKDAVSKNLLPSIKSFSGWFFLVVSVASGAIFEEAVYRQFLPEVGNWMLLPASKKKWISISFDFFCILIFAFSHRYLGKISVLNAFACGSILRLCYKKTFSIWTGTAAHFAYNMTLILFSMLS